MSTATTIETPHGTGRLVTHRAKAPLATVLLSHGAGNGIDTDDLMALAQSLPRNGVSVALFEQPWKVAGRRVATAPATLDTSLVAAANWMRVRTPLVVGGRSAGARSACRTAKRLGAGGVLALAFPLHPPGKPERSRVEELKGAKLPVLLVQGERDPMGRPDDFPDLPGVDMVVLPAADHSLKVGKRGPLSQSEAFEILVESALEWIVRDVAGAHR